MVSSPPTGFKYNCKKIETAAQHRAQWGMTEEWSVAYAPQAMSRLKSSKSTGKIIHSACLLVFTISSFYSSILLLREVHSTTYAERVVALWSRTIVVTVNCVVCRLTNPIHLYRQLMMIQSLSTWISGLMHVHWGAQAVYGQF